MGKISCKRIKFSTFVISNSVNKKHSNRKKVDNVDTFEY